MKKAFFAALVCAAAVFADGTDSLAKVAIHGYVNVDNARLWKADSKGGVYQNDLFTSVIGGLTVNADFGDGFSTKLTLEGKTFRPFPEEQNTSSSRLGKFATYIHEARMRYTYNDPSVTSIDVDAGYFIYKYNPQARNLGEYLFRSQIYPGNLYTDFDFPEEKLLGLRIGNNPIPSFRHDLLVTSEYKFYPKSDVSISYLANVNFEKIVDFGTGVSFHHLFEIKPGTETPKTDDNGYMEIPAQTWRDTLGVEHVISRPFNGIVPDLLETNNDTISFYQDGAQSRQIYPQIKRTVTYYSYRGIKLMGRFTFDINALMGNPELLGKEDLKVYGEATILGIKDFPYYYKNILERIPLMVGFNFPCFKILDMLSIEGEYYASRLPNNGEKALRSAIPQPGSSNFSVWDTTKYSSDDVKWSVYIKKNFSHGLSITAQVSKDHLRMPDEKGYVFESIIKNSDDFWGIIRLTSSF